MLLIRLLSAALARAGGCTAASAQDLEPRPAPEAKVTTAFQGSLSEPRFAYGVQAGSARMATGRFHSSLRSTEQDVLACSCPASAQAELSSTLV
jgi:hypothetical protein